MGIWYERERLPWVVCSYNLGYGAVKRKPHLVFRDIKRFLEEADILCLQECGAAGAILDRVERELDVHVFRGFGKGGQASTALVYKRRPVKRRSYSLSPRTWVGRRGAGPNYMKHKWLNVVKHRVWGRHVWTGTAHTTPSVYLEVREDLALMQTRKMGRVSRWLRGLKFFGGDFNSAPGHKVRRPLRRAGLKSSQREARRKINTKDRRSIDDVYVNFGRGRRVKMVRHWTEEGASDHRAYFVKYAIKPTLRWRMRKRRKNRS